MAALRLERASPSTPAIMFLGRIDALNEAIPPLACDSARGDRGEGRGASLRRRRGGKCRGGSFGNAAGPFVPAPRAKAAPLLRQASFLISCRSPPARDEMGGRGRWREPPSSRQVTILGASEGTPPDSSPASALGLRSWPFLSRRDWGGLRGRAIPPRS